MTENQTVHFSGKILLLSVIFALSGAGIYGLRSLIGPAHQGVSVTPTLLSAMAEEIEVKTTYEEDYRPARENEALYAGSLIRTGEKEFAEVTFGNNAVRLDEETEIRLIQSRYNGTGIYLPGSPKLELELLSGGIWVNAFDPIQVQAKKHKTNLHHSVGIMTYTEPINRIMVVTGDADLSLLNEDGEALTEFVVPLGSQVTFLDNQITDVYAALKASKLRKELKMSAIPEGVMQDDWVTRNAYDFELEQEAYSKKLIHSGLTYRIKQGYQTARSFLAFTQETKRDVIYQKAENMFGYILGGLPDVSDRQQAKAIIEDFDTLLASQSNDPNLRALVVETLFGIEKAAIGTPAYQLRESLMEKVAQKEGNYVYRLYLTDLRRALYEDDAKSAEKIAEKWLTAWPESASRNDPEEFNRQSQILNHTILSYTAQVPTSVLAIFDETGRRKMAYAKDIEEARFEVTSDRLQITAALVSTYRYIEAKQYLKSSYISLDIENLSTQLASTQVFLETGKLLAQRIEYAEVMLHGAAEPINESKFLAYFETVKRDKALSEDLRKFFELDEEEEEVIEEEEFQAPTASEVATRFLDARINVNFADISLVPNAGFTYKIANARLIDRSEEGEILSFDATYDYLSNSVTDVITQEHQYKGSFTLKDIVILLKSGGELESQVPAPKTEGEGIDLLITDQDKIAAEEGQAIAQDVARQLAYKQLKAVGIIVPEVKFDIDILDTLNLNRFHIKNALIPRTGEELAISIRFDYSSASNEASNVYQVIKEGEEKETVKKLLNSSAIDDLAEAVITEIERLESPAPQGPRLPGTSGTSQ